jgi:uncharacterized protein (TIGR01244 family)
VNLQPLTAEFAVAGQIRADDVPALAGDGYVTIVCNRPDHEDAGQPTADEIARACEAHGIDFHHLPFQGMMLPPGLVEEFAARVNASAGPVLAYCRSGQRCGYLWMVSRSLLER